MRRAHFLKPEHAKTPGPGSSPVADAQDPHPGSIATASHDKCIWAADSLAHGLIARGPTPAMPIVPERVRTRQEVRGAINGQFWGQEVATPRSIDGKGQSLPCEPVPLGLTTPPGISRTQQLLAAQAWGLPAMPGYCGESGGLVREEGVPMAWDANAMPLEFGPPTGQDVAARGPGKRR